MLRPLPILTTLFATILLLAGCSAHTLHGRVIRGDASYISVVDEDDPRLYDSGGLPGVQLALEMNPGLLSRDEIARKNSGAQGEFELPVDRFGAGLIKMEMGLVARRSGFQSAESFFTIPLPDSARLLVVLAPGQDEPGAFEEPWSAEEDLRRFGR